jgi:hypothetical protein
MNGKSYNNIMYPCNMLLLLLCHTFKEKNKQTSQNEIRK